MNIYNISEEPLVISKSVMDLLLKKEGSSDLVALYMFYYYTAKWQKTDKPKATRSYVMNGLDIGKPRFLKAKKELLKLHLIEDVIRKEKGKIKGHYIKVKFIWGKEKVAEIAKENHWVENSLVEVENHQAENAPVGNMTPNALSVNNLNSLNSSIKEEGGEGLKPLANAQEKKKNPEFQKNSEEESAPADQTLTTLTNTISNKTIIKVKRHLTEEEEQLLGIYKEHTQYSGSERLPAILKNIPEALHIFKELYAENALIKFDEAIACIMHDEKWASRFKKEPSRLTPQCFLAPKWVKGTLTGFTKKEYVKKWYPYDHVRDVQGNRYYKGDPQYEEAVIKHNARKGKSDGKGGFCLLPWKD